MIKIITILFFAVTFAFAGPVSVYGALKACVIDGKGQICGSGAWANTPVQLRGVSLGWSNTGWESSAFFNATTVNAMVDGWKAEVIRVPLGYGEGGGYSGDASNWTRAKVAIDAAIAKDVYVIIDWHSHTANNSTETSAAKTFFESTVASYHNSAHVIFEIFNEPINQTWTQIKTYSETIVKAIRDKSANNLILIGTPEYSIRPNAASGNYLSDSNVGYVFHFYSQTHATNGGAYGDWTSTYSSGVTTVLNEGKPVFVTEYGTTSADGGDNSKGNYNTHNATASNSWHTFMDIHNISSVAWNVNDKYEGSAFFGTNSSTTSSANRFNQTATNFTNTSMMTASGKYIYDKLVGYANSAPWRTSNTPPSSSSGGSKTTVIDDFEDEDGLANTFEPWYIYTDSNDGGASTVANETDEEGDRIVTYQDGTNWVAYIKDYTLVKDDNPYAPYVALGLDAVNNQIDYDLSKCTDGFSYRYKGVAHNFKVIQSDVKDYAYHFYEVSPASTSWKTITISQASLEQPSWATDEVSLNLKKVNGFAWEIKGADNGTAGLSGLTGSLMIDDFTCLGDMPLPQSASSPPSSSSSGNNSPVMFSPIANKNVMQAIKNGVSLQVTQKATLEVFGLNGNLLRKSNFTSGIYSVSFSDLPKGLYIVKVSFGSERKILNVPVR